MPAEVRALRLSLESLPDWTRPFGSCRISAVCPREAGGEGGTSSQERQGPRAPYENTETFLHPSPAAGSWGQQRGGEERRKELGERRGGEGKREEHLGSVCRRPSGLCVL
ncbi:hypothetical protein GHT09_016549 [Marmota monax]|uniref:Uncharacterized protein n=1 Tax=Marmota monax TaxID=9995 RepID=A0A834Q7F1_MARMO|nr:hypothetical protein GHT09_016549 [Marmota monax]